MNECFLEKEIHDVYDVVLWEDDKQGISSCKNLIHGVMTNNVCLDQMPLSAASDQGLQCLH